MNKSLITEQQRKEAADMGYDICEECGQSYIPAPGFINDGHQCFADGTGDRFTIMPRLDAHTA